MNATTVVPIPTLIANTYLLRGARCVLVDTGNPGSEQTILRRLAQHGVRPHDIALILLTHGHVDHVGSAAALRALTGAPVAIHPRDAAALRAGRNPPLRPSGRSGQVLRLMPFIRRGSPPVEPDIVIDGPFDLSGYGVAGTVLATPGHTPGSLSVLLPDGDAIIGDLLMGGYAAGKLRPHVPNDHYFIDDLAQARASLRMVLGHDPQRLYVGHGGPLRAETVRARFGRSLESDAMQPLGTASR